MSALSEVGRLDETIVEVIEESLAALGDEDSVTRVELLGGLSQELVWRDPRARRLR